MSANTTTDGGEAKKKPLDIIDHMTEHLQSYEGRYLVMGGSGTSWGFYQPAPPPSYVIVNQAQQQYVYPGVSPQHILHHTTYYAPPRNMGSNGGNEGGGCLIENMAGNWAPDLSGTYSPFGPPSQPVLRVPPSAPRTEEERQPQSQPVQPQPIQPQPIQPQSSQPLQTQSIPSQPVQPQSLQPEVQPQPVQPQPKKQRIVAQVKPLRPSYSDVLTKSSNAGGKSPTCSKAQPAKAPPPRPAKSPQAPTVVPPPGAGLPDLAKGDIKRQNSVEENEVKTSKKNVECSTGAAETPPKLQDQSKKSKKSKSKATGTTPSAKEENGRKCTRGGFLWMSDVCHGYVMADSDAEENEDPRPRPTPRSDTAHARKTGKTEKIQGSTRTCSKSKRSSRTSKRKDTKLSLVLKKFQESCSRYLVLSTSWLFNLLIDVSAMSAALMLHLTQAVVRGLADWASGRWAWVKRRWRGRSTPPPPQPSAPLAHNITLPTTGEDAMKRLLSCKGKDPYSILGLTSQCTDEEIRRYYKSQALLVHPDKNSQPGAEEAFKILVHAFDLIAEPEKRVAYDRYVAETNQVEQAWSEMSELLAQLQEKMLYAASTIRCNACGRRHRRHRTERRLYAARFCAQCRVHHSAREGDMWCEYSGWLWTRTYFACMDGAVYDMTEWAKCQGGGLAHLTPHAHLVHYRVLLGQPAPPPPPPTQVDGDFDDLLSSLYGNTARNRNGQKKKKKAK